VLVVHRTTHDLVTYDIVPWIVPSVKSRYVVEWLSPSNPGNHHTLLYWSKTSKATSTMTTDMIYSIHTSGSPTTTNDLSFGMILNTSHVHVTYKYVSAYCCYICNNFVSTSHSAFNKVYHSYGYFYYFAVLKYYKIVFGKGWLKNTISYSF